MGFSSGIFAPKKVITLQGATRESVPGAPFSFGSIHDISYFCLVRFLHGNSLNFHNMGLNCTFCLRAVSIA